MLLLSRKTDKDNRYKYDYITSYVIFEMNFKEIKIKDKYPETKLEEINPISERAYSNLSRCQERIINKENYAVEIVGAIKMMEGLDYYYDNYIENKIKNSENKFHDLTAYINRLGQFYYFVKCGISNTILKNGLSEIPLICKLISIRMKNTAHLSLDCPKGEKIEYRKRQAMMFWGFNIILIEGGKEKYYLPIERNNKTEYVNFTPENDHQSIMIECYQIIDRIIKNIT